MPSPSIPLGFHIWSATFTCVGSTHNNTITCGGKNNGFLTAASIESAWTTATTNPLGPFVNAKFGSNYSLVERKVLANIGGVLQTQVNNSIIAGTGTIANPPLNTAMIIRKDTGFSGRPYQARMMYPPMINEAIVDAAGNIDPAVVANQQTFWTDVWVRLQAAGIDPVVIHDPSTGLVPTKINSFTVKSRLGTIGRRMRR